MKMIRGALFAVCLVSPLIRYGKGHESDRGRWWPCGFQR